MFDRRTLLLAGVLAVVALFAGTQGGASMVLPAVIGVLVLLTFVAGTAQMCIITAMRQAAPQGMPQSFVSDLAAETISIAVAPRDQNEPKGEAPVLVPVTVGKGRNNFANDLRQSPLYNAAYRVVSELGFVPNYVPFRLLFG